MNNPPSNGVLYIVVCAAGPAPKIPVLIDQARARGWDVYAIPTPAAADGFLDLPVIEQATGHPVRATWRKPGDPGKLPPADAVIVAPATYNTINKWSSGIADTYALGLLAELTGPGEVPIAVLPFVNASLAANQAYQNSVHNLRAAGVRILVGEDMIQPHPQGTGGPLGETFPWHLALDEITRNR